ncbi:MAG: AAA family ATPase, partial [Nitrospinae bacterium]|nr:AAA family ATPase [Nitrospinota bacterium]
MYENFYRFKEKPFSLTPDPKFLYLSKQYQGALDHMLYGIKQREGFMVIAGDVGTGKTTLCRCLLDRLDENVEVALILNPMLSDMDLLRNVVHDLGIKSHQSKQPVGMIEDGSTGEEITIELEPSPYEDIQQDDLVWVNNASKIELIDALNSFLLDQHEQGKSTVLIVDEAQNLSLDVMEQLRILSNLETEKEKLLQIIFVGQLELNEKLKLPALKQLNQRISIRYKISPLNKDETKNYIAHRILVAGAASQVNFTESALNEIFKYSKGYPRLINLVCDRALLAGYNAQVDEVDRQYVREAIKSLLGEEDKNYFLNRFLQTQLPLVASLLFFIAGLTFFILSKMEPGQINLTQLTDNVFSKANFEVTPKGTPKKIMKPAAPKPSELEPEQNKKEILNTSTLAPTTPDPALKQEESNIAQPALETPAPKTQEPVGNSVVKQGG